MKRKVLIIENGHIAISEINANRSQSRRKIKRTYSAPITPASRDRLRQLVSQTMYYKGRISKVIYFKCEL